MSRTIAACVGLWAPDAGGATFAPLRGRLEASCEEHISVGTNVLHACGVAVTRYDRCMFCTVCHSQLSPLRRSDQVTCSSRCRVAAHRALPAQELRDRPRWVRRMASKMPVQCDGAAASSTNPDTWCDYRTAAGSDVGAGLGFVLNGDGIVCVDLDHCLDGRGRALPLTIELLEGLPDTYIEVSPSGDGLHVWGFGSVRRGRVTPGVEVYGTGRYITVTGRRWRGSVSTFANLDEWIGSLPI